MPPVVASKLMASRSQQPRKKQVLRIKTQLPPEMFLSPPRTCSS
jgi:hypothetical protein